MPLPSWHQKDHLAILWTELVNINISTSIEYPLVNSHNFGLNHQFSYVNQLLVGGWAYPSEKSWTSSAGIMTLPTEWTNKIHVPNHQPGISLSTSVISERSWASWQRPLCLFHVAQVMCTKHATPGPLSTVPWRTNATVCSLCISLSCSIDGEQVAAHSAFANQLFAIFGTFFVGLAGYSTQVCIRSSHRNERYITSCLTRWGEFNLIYAYAQ